jgi:periplasmic protein TonB
MSEPLAIPEHPSTGKGLWVAAATIAVSMHLAFAALAYVHLQHDAESDDLGAPGIEIDFVLTSPRTPLTELPPGPDSEASVATPAVAEQVAEVKEAELPKETPVETENPDQQVTIETSTKPKEESPEVKVKTQASEESIAQDATAAPSLPNATEAEKSVTVDQGTGESRQRVRVTWQKELLAHLDKHKKYPSDRIQKTARILLSLELDRMGRVVSVGVVESSGDEAFDEAARAMVQRASPVPPPPPLVADESLTFTLPVNFRADRKR